MSVFISNLASKFVWRRAFRSASRSVTRSDLVEAFGMSNSAASALLSGEARISNGLLVREGKRVTAPGWAEPPTCAGEKDLMDHLHRGLTELCFTGLFEDELPVNQVRWDTQMPEQPGAFAAVTQAIVCQSAIYLSYVTMEMGDTGQWRRVAPLSLDCVGGQWRLVAQDLEDQASDFPVKSFVLAQILDVKPDTQKWPRGFIRASGLDSVQRHAVEFDGRLTREQRKVMSHKLSVREGLIELPRRSVPEFQAQHTSEAANEPAVKALLRLEPR